MVTTLYLLRHGETEGADVRRYKGSLDVPLSPKGWRQAEEAAAFVLRRAGGVSAVYSSSLSRAVDSAAPLARAFVLGTITLAGLRERHFGLWEGMSFDEIQAAYPGDFADWAADPLRFSPPGGESTLEVRDRAVPVMEGIIVRHAGGSLVAVAHGGVNRVLLCHWLGVPLENIFRLEQDHACVNIVEFHDGYPVVRLINGGV